MKKEDEKPVYVSGHYVRRVADELGVQIESGKVFFNNFKYFFKILKSWRNNWRRQ